jgi:hypothetical protein
MMDHRVEEVLQRSGPGVTVPKAVIVMVWMSFRTIVSKLLAKENTWLEVPVTSGCLGSDLVKKEGVFICRIRLKEYHNG